MHSLSQLKFLAACGCSLTTRRVLENSLPPLRLELGTSHYSSGMLLGAICLFDGWEETSMWAGELNENRKGSSKNIKTRRHRESKNRPVCLQEEAHGYF